MAEGISEPIVQPKAKFNQSIQGLRGVAALTVLVCHFANEVVIAKVTPAGSAFIPYLIVGRHGVELFFMISGFLITHSIMRHGNVRDFLVDRALRIYPAYVPVLLLIFIGGPFIGYDYFSGMNPRVWPLKLLENLFFVPGVVPIRPALGVAWTLSWEAAFYLVSAMIYAIWSRHKQAGIWFGILVTIALILVFPRFSFFTVGAVCYFLREVIKRYAQAIGAASLISFPIFYGLCAWRRSYEDVGLVDSGYVSVAVASVTVGALLFASIAAESGTLSRILRAKAFQFLGMISYSFYLWHTLIMVGTKKIFRHLVGPLSEWGAIMVFFALSFGLTTIVAWGSYKVFEQFTSNWFAERIKIRSARAAVPVST